MPTYNNDTELLIGLQRKESSAGFVVFERYVKRLTWFIEKITQNTQAAQDIATESFLKVFERPADFQTLAKLEAFLFTVANNSALNWLESAKRQQQRLKDYQPADNQPPIERTFLLSEAVQAVHEIIEDMPPQVRQVVRLSLLGGKKLEEIAREMNITYKTVQHHKAKGFKILRERLVGKGFHYAVILAILSREPWS